MDIADMEISDAADWDAGVEPPTECPPHFHRHDGVVWCPKVGDPSTPERHGRVGIAVTCSTCHRHKKPLGRSAAWEMASSLCDRDCSGYDLAPKPGTLWPGETCEDFGGYAHSHEATVARDEQ